MRKPISLALAFLAMAGASSTLAGAAEEGRRFEERHNRAGMRFERTDTDSSGDITFEEFSAAIDERLATADADGDGKMTVAEIADEIERMRAERMARRLVERFDMDGDGALTKAEIENRQRKMFALLDRNDDGKITREEMQQGSKRRHGFHRQD